MELGGSAKTEYKRLRVGYRDFDVRGETSVEG